MEKAHSFPRFPASAKGICYTGVSAVLMDKWGEYIVVSANVEDLKIRWASMTHIPLDDALIEQIALFSLKSISEEGKNAN